MDLANIEKPKYTSKLPSLECNGHYRQLGASLVSHMHVSLSRRRRRTLPATLALGCVLISVVMVNARLRSPLPTLRVSSHTPATIVARGSLPRLPWPAQGEAAVAIPSISTAAVASTLKQRAVPIASLAKLMTAYLVLKHLPLVIGSQGPVITISAADEQQYYNDVAQDQSSVQVTAGEHLTEYQLLQALLTRSANNVAQLLATWVAGSEAAFVSQMNQTATRIGLTDTHFADASGFSSATKATAKAIATIAAIDMRNPVFDRIVNEHTVTLPLVGTLPNIVARIGTANVVGIKSGYTIWSGGCAAIATQEPTKVGKIEAVAVVLDQQGPASLHHAASIAERLANEASLGVIRATVARSHQSIGSLKVPWAASTQPASNLILSHALTANLWPGQKVTYKLHLIAASALIGTAPGTVAGYLQVQWPLHNERISVVTTERIQAPSDWWRLVHA